jgi:hypothetical protein
MAIRSIGRRLCLFERFLLNSSKQKPHPIQCSLFNRVLNTSHTLYDFSSYLSPVGLIKKLSNTSRNFKARLCWPSIYSSKESF